MLGEVHMFDSATDIAIYVINNETKYFDDANSIKIPKDRFIDVVRYLNTHYGAIETEYDRTDPHFDKSDVNNAYRLALYNSLKNLYDKWANSYDETDFRLRHPSDDYRIKASRFQNGEQNNDNACEFDNFMFVDCFYNDISDIFRMNPLVISDIVGKQVQAESNYSVYECMADIMQKNRMLLLTLPVYCNFYNFNEIEKLFTPNPMGIMSKGLGSTYVGMYTYEVSHVVDDERFDDHLDKDYFMIADLNGVADDPRPTKEGEQLFSYNGKRLSIPVPAFGVTYARQNQSYFKRIDVNMDNPRVTDYSIYNMFLLTNSVEGNELNRPLTVANDIYSIYANRSYNCSVEMMGCANIMPMMYFQLNNIPMFRGAYMISNVEHHISAGNFTTKFSGVRISKNQLPYNTKIFDYDNSFDFNTVGGGVIGLTESPVSYNNNVPFRDVDSKFNGAGPGKEPIPDGFPSDQLLFEFLSQAEGTRGLQWVTTYKGDKIATNCGINGWDFSGGVHNPAIAKAIGVSSTEFASWVSIDKSSWLSRRAIGGEIKEGAAWGWATTPLPASHSYWQKLIPYYRDNMIWAWNQPGIQAIKSPGVRLARMHTCCWYFNKSLKGLTIIDAGWKRRVELAIKLCGG
jgi:hypothetical protein